MADYTVKKVDEMDAIFFNAFKRAGDELEVASFGMNIIDFPPDAGEQYPEHDHAHDGQEEVYLVMRGSGRIVIEGGEEHPLDGDTIVRVGSGTTRKVWAGSDGMRLVIVGGVPGGTYERPDVSRVGQPDPAAA